MSKVLKTFNERFDNLNVNPKHRSTGDCVVRALSTALNERWEVVYRELFELGIKKCITFNDDKNVKEYLETKGIKQRPMPRHEDRTRYTVNEFIDKLADKDHSYIIRIAGHMTCVKNKRLIDTSDCGAWSVGNYWEV